MTTKDLFRCIGNLSDGMIEEAADIKRKPRWLPIAALAACAVLAISIPLAVLSANSTKSASTADTSAAETPAAEAPAEAPAEADSAVGATARTGGQRRLGRQRPDRGTHSQHGDRRPAAGDDGGRSRVPA